MTCVQKKYSDEISKSSVVEYSSMQQQQKIPNKFGSIGQWRIIEVQITILFIIIYYHLVQKLWCQTQCTNEIWQVWNIFEQSVNIFDRCFCLFYHQQSILWLLIVRRLRQSLQGNMRPMRPAISSTDKLPFFVMSIYWRQNGRFCLSIIIRRWEEFVGWLYSRFCYGGMKGEVSVAVGRP